MISNLQFYGAAALIGFVISLGFRKEKEIPKWSVWAVFLFPACWALLGPMMIMAVGDRSVNGYSDVLAYFDSEVLFSSQGYRKGQFLVLLISPIYFALLFRLVWRIKNKHIKTAQKTSASRRV